MRKTLFTFCLLFLAGLLAGCTVNGEPRTRMGSYASATAGTNFIGLNELGKHNYKDLLFEGNGIAYTCRGGHIDTAHVRIAADYVYYLYHLTRKSLDNGNTTIPFKMNIEPSKYFATITYPPGWYQMPQARRDAISTDVAMDLSQYIAYTMTTWHEVITWFGFKSVGIFSECPSAFSWEDNYSNLVGVIVGGEALKNSQLDFDTAVTLAIQNELIDLQIQPKEVSKFASEKMRGRWYTGTVLVEMKERNMDIGLIDGFVTPTLIPGICPDAAPQSYPVPALKSLEKYGFKFKLEVEPKEFEREKILKIVYPNHKGTMIDLPDSLPLIMDHIQAQAVKKGYNTMPPKFSPLMAK